MTLNVYAGSLGVTHVDGILAAIEAALPIGRLVYRIDDDGEIHEVQRPAEWLMERFDRGEIPLLCNGVEHRLVSFAVGNLYRPRPEPPLYEYALRANHFASESFPRLFALMQRVTSTALALRGDAFTGDTASRVVQSYLGHLERPLPPAHPAVIGWINYWSADTCRLLGFAPDDPRRGLFARAETDAHHDGGGVTLQVTGDPLDLDRPDHRAALDALYDAFPQIPQQALRARRPRVTQ